MKIVMNIMPLEVTATTKFLISCYH